MDKQVNVTLSMAYNRYEEIMKTESLPNRLAKLVKLNATVSCLITEMNNDFAGGRLDIEDFMPMLNRANGIQRTILLAILTIRDLMAAQQKVF